ncbi:AAA family ATPase [Photobacterium sp. CAU 1568]|uniref:AAA family ATPase n=1 Tax=Photobacterium arenosum TaxID=2774143 RepID=A0ABR9BMH8_9GAMM|nr:AAA family ATPase [Photobacterium arenosum]MBD8512676.1 AAA family ATPase [Photobacterium arenosum]
MYKAFFGLTEAPFSIVPSARFLYLSDRHREALNHMLAGLTDGGGFGLLTGEVGTGKTTVLRALLSKLGEETQVAVVLNPALSAHELLESICDELGLQASPQDSYKILTDRLYGHLKANDQAGRHTLLLVDEAQHLLPDVLEQLRLLTNLENDQRKLLKVVLAGQPELQQLLQQPGLRQLAQRITSRYHLLPLTEVEVAAYVRFRLDQVGCAHQIFSPQALKTLARVCGGIPRQINLVCDKALQLACRDSRYQINPEHIKQASELALGWAVAQPAQVAGSSRNRLGWTIAAILAPALIAAGYWGGGWVAENKLGAVVQETAVVSAPAASGHSPETDQAQALTALEKRWQAVLALQPTERQAMQTLYQLWGYEVSPSQANCLSSTRIGLTCQQSKGDLAQLSLINRPAILPLTNDDGDSFYAVLYALWPGEAELMLGGERLRVSREWLQAHWQQDYTLMWRPPMGESTSIRYGQQGSRVAWLDQQLNRLLGEPGVASRDFDQSVLDKLRRFQQAQGLYADGIAGPMTLMVLDTALSLPGPTLHQEYRTDGDTVIGGHPMSFLPLPRITTEALPAPGLPLYSNAERSASEVWRPLNSSSGEQPFGTAAGNTAVMDTTAMDTAASDSQMNFLDLDKLDLSGLSPELANRLHQAIAATDQADTPALVDPRTVTAAVVKQKPYVAENVMTLADLPQGVQARLPAINLQTHIYSSSADSRWVKVNNREAYEGDEVAPGVTLEKIEPRKVILDFEHIRFEMAALSQWPSG